MISENIQALQKLMKELEIDLFAVTSNDQFLNEYTPLEDCHRYYLTNFTGSTAEVLVPQKGRVKLYVDGRYFDQADLEVDPSLVEVVKTNVSDGLFQAVYRDIEPGHHVAVEGNRISAANFISLSEKTTISSFDQDELKGLWGVEPRALEGTVRLVTKEARGRSTQEKIDTLNLKKGEGAWISALDSLAWFSNCRGYQFPYLSSFGGSGLMTKDRLILWIPEASDVSGEVLLCQDFEVRRGTPKIDIKLDRIIFDPHTSSARDYQMLSRLGVELSGESGYLLKTQSLKSTSEIELFESAFERSGKAIFETIKESKAAYKKGETVSECSVADNLSRNYRSQGSIGHSFNTIAGVGPNSAIMHYGTPSKENILTDDNWILLDSGAYYESGIATDCTRTFSVNPKGEAIPQKLKEMYTLCLKGYLQAAYAIFPVRTPGKVVDGYARGPLYAKGLDYRHGTGHGVGVYVHEGGVRISSVSDLPMVAGQIVSIEPGYYISGEAGVRIENVAVVKKHPEHEGFLCFESLIYCGLEPDLILNDELTGQEQNWLNDYEAKCARQGNSFIK